MEGLVLERTVVPERGVKEKVVANVVEMDEIFCRASARLGYPLSILMRVEMISSILLWASVSCRPASSLSIRAVRRDAFMVKSGATLE